MNSEKELFTRILRWLTVYSTGARDTIYGRKTPEDNKTVSVGWIDRWWVTVISSLIAVVVLFLLTKIMGKRQISQLSLFDYINGITIGSIAAELATMANGSLIRPLIGLGVYALSAVLIATAANKSINLRRFFGGRPLVLFDSDRFYLNNLKKAKIDINEFLTALRCQGYFDLSTVRTAVLETNGRISVLPYARFQPPTASDMRVPARETEPLLNLIIDGNVMETILRHSGKNRIWLEGCLAQAGVQLGDCCLGTLDGDGVFRAYREAPETDQDQPLFL